MECYQRVKLRFCDMDHKSAVRFVEVLKLCKITPQFQLKLRQNLG